MKSIGIYTRNCSTFLILQSHLNKLGLYKGYIHHIHNYENISSYDLVFIDYFSFLYYLFSKKKMVKNVILIIEEDIKSISELDLINCMPFIRMNKIKDDLYNIAKIFNLSFYDDNKNIFNNIYLIQNRISHITSEKNYIYLHIASQIRNDNSTYTSQKMKCTLKKIQKILKNHFIKCNRGTLVNIKYIHSYQRQTQTIKLINGTILPVSFSHKKEFQRLYTLGYFLNE